MDPSSIFFPSNAPRSNAKARSFEKLTLAKPKSQIFRSPQWDFEAFLKGRDCDEIPRGFFEKIISIWIVNIHICVCIYTKMCNIIYIYIYFIYFLEIGSTTNLKGFQTPRVFWAFQIPTCLFWLSPSKKNLPSKVFYLFQVECDFIMFPSIS